VEQVSGNCLLDPDHSHNTHLGEDQMESEEANNTTKSRIRKFIDFNIMKAAERRLTIPNKESKNAWQLSKENIELLKESYRHPFAKVPETFYRDRKTVF